MPAVSSEPASTGSTGTGSGISRLVGLDGLRAIAAFAVFFHHVGFHSGRTYDGAIGRYIGRLDIGVPIFFVLSGFLLFRPIAAAVIDERPLRPTAEYLWRRFMRIYPAFWAALLLIVLFTSEDLGLADGITTSLLSHIYWTDHVVGPIPQAWSLATEVSFYLVLPLFARFLIPWLADRGRPQRRNALFVFVAGCYLLSVFFRICMLGLDNQWSVDALLWLPGMFDYFAIGMALGVARVGFEHGSVQRVRLERLAAPAGWWWIGAALLFYVVSQRMGLALGLDVASWPREIGRQFVYGAIGFALLFPLVFGTDRRSYVRRFVASRPMDWLGKISYSIYLWHMAFIVHPWGPMTEFFGEVKLFETNYWRLCIVAFIPMFVVAVASYYLVERLGLRMQGLVRRESHGSTSFESAVERFAARWRAASFRLQLVVITAAGLALRVIYVIVVKRDQTLETVDVFPGDQFYYSLAADALADGKGFVTPWHGLFPGIEASHAADHPPLTAMVATPASWLPGGQGEHIFEQRFIMCVVGAGVIVMIGLLARQLAGRAVGLTAAGIAAVYPALWINDGLVMAESLTVFCIAGAVWTALRYRLDPSGRLAIQLGAWIGFAALARSESLLLAVLLVVPVAVLSHPHWRERAKAVVVSGAVTALVIAPWVVPNLLRFNEPVLMSTNDGVTLIGANSPQTYAGGAIGFWSLEYADTLAGGLPELQGADTSEQSRIWRTEAFSYIGDNLDDLPRVMAARLGRLWSVFRPMQMSDFNTGEGREIWASNLAFVSFWVMAPLALIGWWRLGRDQLTRWPLAILAVHVSLVGALIYGIPRFRAPAEIAVVVCAATAIHWLSSLGTCPPRPISSSPPSSS